MPDRSELPERLGAFDALLAPREADIGQSAIVQRREMQARPSTRIPGRKEVERGPPGEPREPRRRACPEEGRKDQRHRFLSLIHLFQGQHRLVLSGCKREMIHPLH